MAHTLKTRVGVDEEAVRVVDVSDSVPGKWSDIKLLKTSRLLKRRPKGVRGIRDLAYVGVAALQPEGPGAAPDGRIGRPRIGGTAGHSAGDGSWSSTPSGG